MTGGAIVGTSWRPAVGQTVCGDVCAVLPRDRGTLLCLADGLGHGEDAHTAATVACDYAREHAEDRLEALLHGMDRALVGTRGAAISLVSLHPATGRLEFAGVGNVEIRAVSRAPIAPPAAPGIVGRGLRKVRVWEYSLAASDLVILISDGISGRFDLDALADLRPQAIAEAIVDRHHKAHDDACCVVARIGGA